MAILSELLNERKSFIVIGLTGRTGSGCSTTANILESEKTTFPDASEVFFNQEPFYKSLDFNRYDNIIKFYRKSHYRFFSIRVSDLITAYLLSISKRSFYDFIKFVSKSEQSKSIILKSIHNLFNSEKVIVSNINSSKCQNIIKKILGRDDKFDKNEIDYFYKCIFCIRKFTLLFKETLNNIKSDFFTKLYQEAGNSIRKIGKISKSYIKDDFVFPSIYHLPETINFVIKRIKQIQTKKQLPCYIIIDAIRNPYEAKFFKDRYSAFYLVSINTKDSDRRKYLQDKYNYSLDQIDELESKESGEIGGPYSEIIGPNVQKCIEISDIHIFNPKTEKDNHNVLKSQLAWYITLMQHPGLITPTSRERCMQIAYSAKLNSGCISRQVGAVVTDNNYSIKSIGWNDIPKGQIPCNLRSLDGLMNNFNNKIYSEYELTNSKFRTEAKEKLKKYWPIKETGRNLSYCFKKIKNDIDNEKNQVHTRALHAEENAFLQISKYGGIGIEGGKLFTTASPCELCAKKAYQLGIKEIIFIDPYPGIAKDHILMSGCNQPNLVQFYGAIGRGYHQLYEPIMPYKDELDYLFKSMPENKTP